MRAAAKVEPRPGLSLVDVSSPEPAPGEVLVEVAYCGICGSDLPVYRWEGYPEKWEAALPRVVGHEFAGRIVAVGGDADARKAPIGALVAVEPGVTCGVCRWCQAGHSNLCQRRSIIGIDRDGALAPLISVPAENVHVVPRDVDLRHAAFLEVLAIAVHAIERARLTPTSRVLVLGVGAIGLSVAALARLSGCEELAVAGVEKDRSLRLPLARAMGATSTLLVDELGDVTGRFDVVVEASGAPGAVAAALRAAATGGRVVAVGTPAGDVPIPWEELVLRAVRVTPIRARLPEHWRKAAALVGRLSLPEGFFATFPLERVDEAFESALQGSAVKVLVDAGGAAGSIET